MIDVYYTPGSPACRFVLLVTAALAIPVNMIFVDLKKDEQMHPEFLQINPQHSVPTIVDNGYVLWESRAIARYLVNQYSESCQLYPLDPRERGLVDQRLDFDLGTLCPAFSQYFYPHLFSGSPPTEALKKKVEEATRILDTFLEDKEYVAGGPNMTIADLSLVTTVSTMDAIGFDLQPYPNIVRWFEVIKSTAPGYERYNEAGLQEFRKLVEDVSKARAQVQNEKKSQTQANEKKSVDKPRGSSSQQNRQSRGNLDINKVQSQGSEPTVPDQTKNMQNKPSSANNKTQAPVAKTTASELKKLEVNKLQSLPQTAEAKTTASKPKKLDIQESKPKSLSEKASAPEPPKKSQNTINSASDTPQTQTVKPTASEPKKLDLQERKPQTLMQKPSAPERPKKSPNKINPVNDTAESQVAQVTISDTKSPGEDIKPVLESMLFKESRPEIYSDSRVMQAAATVSTSASESKVVPPTAKVVTEASIVEIKQDFSAYKK